MKAWLALFLLLVSTGADAALSQHALREVALAPPPGATLPLDLSFRDSSGRDLTLRQAIGAGPALLLLVDYSCNTVCKPALAITAGALAQTGLVAGRDYHLIVAGIDAKDRPADASQMLQQIGDPAVAAATVALMNDNRNVDRLAQTAGYSFTYDPDIDQFAHPAGLLVLTAGGRISRALSSLAINPQDLRLAVIEAGAGRVGTITDRLTLLCYGFDAAHGVYAPAIRRLLQIAGAATVLALAAALLLLRRREPKTSGAQP